MTKYTPTGVHAGRLFATCSFEWIRCVATSLCRNLLAHCMNIKYWDQYSSMIVFSPSVYLPHLCHHENSWPMLSLRPRFHFWSLLLAHNRTNALRYRNSFLLVSHDVDNLQPFLSLSSLVGRLTYCRSSRIASASSALSRLLLCIVFYLYSNSLVVDFVLPTHFQYSPVASHLKRHKFFWSQLFSWSMSQQHRADGKRRMTSVSILVFKVNSLLLHKVFNIHIFNLLDWFSGLLLHCSCYFSLSDFQYTFEYYVQMANMSKFSYLVVLSGYLPHSSCLAPNVAEWLRLHAGVTSKTLYILKIEVLCHLAGSIKHKRWMTISWLSSIHGYISGNGRNIQLVTMEH